MLICMQSGWKSVCSNCAKSVYQANEEYRRGLEGNATASDVLDMLITNYAHLSVLK